MNKIILDCERMKYVNTGLFYYCLNLGKHLQSNLDQNREQLSFFYPSAIPPYFGNAKYLVQNSAKKFWMPSLKGHSIWHCTYQNSAYVPRRNKNIRVVLSIHDLNFLYQDKPEQKKTKYLRHLQRNIDRSDVIVCVSEYCMKDVLAHCDIKGKPLQVIYNGTNELASPALTDVSYKPAKPFLFSLGVICRKKNVHTLLPLVKESNDLELIIAGRPDDLEYLNFIRQSAQELQVEEKVRLLPDISEAEKSWYFRNCYAFMMPSLAEGFGLPVVEAMSVGKPVFLSRQTALPEIGADQAFYFDDFDARRMHHVFLEGMRRYREDKMEASIKEHTGNFCWNRTARQYIDVYRSLTNQDEDL